MPYQNKFELVQPTRREQNSSNIHASNEFAFYNTTSNTFFHATHIARFITKMKDYALNFSRGKAATN